MKHYFNNKHVTCSVELQENFTIIVQGAIHEPTKYASMQIMAAAPMMQMTSYSGSGLPYPCAAYAFDNTPNRHDIEPNGKFNVRFYYPNSYYLEDGRTKITPSIFVVLTNAEPIHIRFELPDPVVLRTLAHRTTRTGPEFYAAKELLLGVQSQEANLRQLGAMKERYGVA
jgi:hypothetical protein